MTSQSSFGTIRALILPHWLPVFLGLLLSGASCRESAPGVRPNVLLILTDDQGYGQVGFHGNQQIRTPNLDRLAAESFELTQFYVEPACAPTRAALLTGRYCQRTGVISTGLARALLPPEEQTLAELLGEAGYRTALFGKYHLGDNYPLRPLDQGFQEVLRHRGGGIGFYADPPGNGYFHPVLEHNGKPRRYQGYCTDIFTDAAIRFIEDTHNRPFFVYLPTNVPHNAFTRDAITVGESYVKPYLDLGMEKRRAETYGMLTNLDENLGRLLGRLRDLGLDRNTIVIFTTDNGPKTPAGTPQQFQDTAGLRGRKNSIYEGGIRVPFLIRWPEAIEGGRKLERIAAHIDVLPTLLEACGVSPPPGLKLDGRSLLPLLTESGKRWPDRLLFFQFYLGETPEPNLNFAARSQRYKLVQPAGGRDQLEKDAGLELYDMEGDAGERNNVAANHPAVVQGMHRAYLQWHRDVYASFDPAPPAIVLGAPHQNPTVLTVFDRRGDHAQGHWRVQVAQKATYQITLHDFGSPFRQDDRYGPIEEAGQAHVRLGEVLLSESLEKGESSFRFHPTTLEEGEGRLEAWVECPSYSVSARYVEIRRLD